MLSNFGLLILLSLSSASLSRSVSVSATDIRNPHQLSHSKYLDRQAQYSNYPTPTMSTSITPPINEDDTEYTEELINDYITTTTTVTSATDTTTETDPGIDATTDILSSEPMEVEEYKEELMHQLQLLRQELFRLREQSRSIRRNKNRIDADIDSTSRRSENDRNTKSSSYPVNVHPQHHPHQDNLQDVSVPLPESDVISWGIIDSAEKKRDGKSVDQSKKPKNDPLQALWHLLSHIIPSRNPGKQSKSRKSSPTSPAQEPKTGAPQ